MISLSTQALAGILGAAASGIADIVFDGVEIDSRRDCSGRLFVAIRGANFDGHAFVDAAYRGGAVAALVETPQDCEIPQIVVADAREAMGRLANYWRRLCDPRVVALTGSNGKTTVKEMLYRILVRQAPTLKTQGNYNNDIGVPLTLFGLGAEHEFAIIEMGANHRGEIARLAEIAEPDIVYVNNAAAAHLEGFGDLRGVVEAKGELYAFCSAEQSALFNIDEDATRYWRGLCAAATQLSCALDADADVGATWQAVDDGVAIEFATAGETRGCRLAVPGEHNVRNALAAVSLALLAGIDFAAAVESLDGFAGVKGRLQTLPGAGGSRLIDDSYNANPESLAAGIDVLCALPGEAWLALGDMGELGPGAEALHREAGRRARDAGVVRLYTIGPLARLASDEFGAGGASYDDFDALADALRGALGPGINLLVKGSRAAGMERLVASLRADGDEERAHAV